MDIYSAKFSQDKKFYVYQYLRSHKSKYGDIMSPYYIGKGQGNRAYSKLHTIHPPQDRSKIQFLAKNMNEADALQVEMLLIQLYGRINNQTGCLRNLTVGGKGSTGYRHTEQTKEKLKGNTFSLGHKHSKETKQRMSNSHKGVLNHQFGKPHTVETKQKISLAEKGKINSASARLKMSKAHLGSRNHMFGKHHTLETKQKISLARQKSIEPIPNNL